MADFPEIRTGVVSQLPYTKTRAFRTVRNSMPCGIQYAWQGRDSALLGYELAFNGITAAEASTLEEHFRGQRGRHLAFDYLDPDDLYVHRMRYDQDELALRHLGPDEIAVTIRLIEARL